MNLLDRYIFKSVLFTCAAAVGLFAFVLIVGNAMKELMGYVLAGQIDLVMLARLLALLVPFVVTFALPMGVLTGILLTLGRLSADSEVTAMRASGISLARIARPVIILGILGAAAALYINQFAMPWARATYRRDLAAAVRANPLSMIVPRTFIRQFPGVVVYVGDKKGSVLHDLWFWQLDRRQRAVRVVRAAEGSVTYDETSNALVLTLRGAHVELRNEKNPEDFTQPTIVGSFSETEALRLSLDKMFSQNTVRTKLDFVSYAKLKDEHRALEVAPPHETAAARLSRERAMTRIELVLSERFNDALAVLSFALIGVPLGIKVSRRETSANMGVALALALGYYFLITAIGWLEKAPEWKPALLLYLPNLIVIASAALLFRRASSH
ncbi:lipopolysaccharide export system permease protein LptF [mine drainage metagenome]|uniref:Lipopolysaccharide export system permease protein LptF n=1 Tax=mine drainage metagenome TaxID=410659 RepID=A0A1J5SU61_9ZZZZ